MFPLNRVPRRKPTESAILAESGVTWSREQQQIFRVQNGRPILPRAQSLDEAELHRSELLSSGIAFELEEGVNRLLRLEGLDQSWVDLDSRPNHLVYSGAADHRGPHPRNYPDMSPNDTVDVELTKNQANQVQSMKVYGPSRAVGYAPNPMAWRLEYFNDKGITTTKYEDGYERIQLIKDSSKGTLTVITQYSNR